MPKGSTPLVIGDLNVNLESPRTKRGENIADELDFMGMSNMTHNFRQSQARSEGRKWTWRMRR